MTKLIDETLCEMMFDIWLSYKFVSKRSQKTVFTSNELHKLDNV